LHCAAKVFLRRHFNWRHHSEKHHAAAFAESEARCMVSCFRALLREHPEAAASTNQVRGGALLLAACA
jgi:hypothetical protein